MTQLQDATQEAVGEIGATIGEQVGIKSTEDKAAEAHGFKGFWEDFRDQLSGGDSKDEMDRKAQAAGHAEGAKTPQEIAHLRRRLQELNAPSAPTTRHEYKGPQVPTGPTPQPQQQTSGPEYRGPQVPTAQNDSFEAPSSLTFAKQGSNEMMKKMVG